MMRMHVCTDNGADMVDEKLQMDLGGESIQSKGRGRG